MRELIRREQDRQHLRGLLLTGGASEAAAPVDEAYFTALRQRVHRAPGAAAHPRRRS